jgi:hypothetical protein
MWRAVFPLNLWTARPQPGKGKKLIPPFAKWPPLVMNALSQRSIQQSVDEGLNKMIVMQREPQGRLLRSKPNCQPHPLLPPFIPQKDRAFWENRQPLLLGDMAQLDVC